MQVASYFGWPVSTTHCIIGALVGFGLVYGGIGAVYWNSLARVVASWVVSPVLGAVVSFVVYRCIRTVCACQQEHFSFISKLNGKPSM
jgi:sodium-dependent phosphate transporter